jgi:anaerobic dimethyl sulfoxide reductase subunit B (iron-sulfur subunit)
MGEQWGFYFDPNNCMGCNACAIACKDRHGIEDEHVDWRRVETATKGTFPNYQEKNVSMSCMHCEDAPCEKVCPTNAIQKRDSDGIVTINRDACIGCGYCEWACPYGAPQYGDEGLMQKCNLCLDKGPGSGHGATSKNEQEEPLEPASTSASARRSRPARSTNSSTSPPRRRPTASTTTGRTSSSSPTRATRPRPTTPWG